MSTYSLTGGSITLGDSSGASVELPMAGGSITIDEPAPRRPDRIALQKLGGWTSVPIVSFSVSWRMCRWMRRIVRSDRRGTARQRRLNRTRRIQQARKGGFLGVSLAERTMGLAVRTDA